MWVQSPIQHPSEMIKENQFARKITSKGEGCKQASKKKKFNKDWISVKE